MTHSILVADDDVDLLNCFVELGGNAGFRVLVAPNGEEAIEMCWSERYDVALLDYRMPDITGIEAMREIKEMRPSVPVFIMSGEGDIPMAVTAIKCGATDFIVKPMDFAEVLSVLKEAANKTPASICEGPESYDRQAHEILTERELEILALTSEGESGKAIGERLNISSRTVETYRQRIKKKLGVKSKAEMIRFAINNGFVHATK